MLELVLPAGVESEECFGEAAGGFLFPEEDVVVASAVERRRREYATVRGCARACLSRLGYPWGPIPTGAEGAPAWPAGARGSMTHCAGYAAAAVGLADRIAAIGIDAEPDGPLPDGVLEEIATPPEREQLDRRPAPPGEPSWDRLLFSAKEAVYKAWFPVVGEWLDPGEAEILVEPQAGTFRAVLSRDGLVAHGRPVTVLEGRWVRQRGILVTAVVLAR